MALEILKAIMSLGGSQGRIDSMANRQSADADSAHSAVSEFYYEFTEKLDSDKVLREATENLMESLSEQIDASSGLYQVVYDAESALIPITSRLYRDAAEGVADDWNSMFAEYRTDVVNAVDNTTAFFKVLADHADAVVGEGTTDDHFEASLADLVSDVRKMRLVFDNESWKALSEYDEVVADYEQSDIIEDDFSGNEL